MIQEEYFLKLLYPDATVEPSRINRQWYIRSTELLIPVKYAYTPQEAWVKTFQTMVPENVQKALMELEKQRAMAERSEKVAKENLRKIRTLVVQEGHQFSQAVLREKVYALTLKGDADETVQTRAVDARSA